VFILFLFILKITVILKREIFKKKNKRCFKKRSRYYNLRGWFTL